MKYSTIYFDDMSLSKEELIYIEKMNIILKELTLDQIETFLYLNPYLLIAMLLQDDLDAEFITKIYIDENRRRSLKITKLIIDHPNCPSWVKRLMDDDYVNMLAA